MLMLRKGTQPLLDAIGLEDLHTEIKSNVLVLVGACGKHLVSINGISFNGTPTAEEREYATELFEQFLAKHGDDLRAFVVASKEFATIEPPVLPEGMRYSPHKTCMVNIPNGIDQNSSTPAVMNIGIGFVTVNNAFNPEVLQEALNVHRAPAVAYIEALQEYQDRLNVLEKARTKIQTCSI